MELQRLSHFSLKHTGPIILVLIFTTIILLGTSLPGRNRLMLSLQDSGHFLIFFPLTLVVLWISRQRHAGMQWLIMLLLLLFGVLVEVMQSFVGRDPSLYDLLMDLLGIIAGGTLYAGFVRCPLAPYQSIILVLVLALAAFFKPLYWFSVYQVRMEQFPRLLDPDRYLSRALVEGSHGGRLHHIELPRQWATEAGLAIDSCVYVSLHEGGWPGVDMQEPEPDWRGYESLEVGLYSDQSTDLPLTLRVHDKKYNTQFTDRYNVLLLLKPGYNHFSLQLSEIAQAPKARRMDLGEISRVMIYAQRKYAGSSFCLLSMGLR
jgi:hypothetical protein